MIVHTRSKKQEKHVQNFLEELDIAFTIVEEDAGVYKKHPPKSITKKESQLLDNLSQSVNFVIKHRKGKVKAKTLNQFLDEL